MAGGFKQFGPTYKTTDFVRLAIEGDINGFHAVDVAAAQAVNGELAGKIAAITANGVGLANKGQGAVGLFREDLNDMVNASLKASFYFRGGEYYVAAARLSDPTLAGVAVGDALTTDAKGRLVKLTDPATEAKVGTVTFLGEYRNGNMFEWAGTAANGGLFLGFILHM